MSKVIVYTKDYCPYCVKAKALLKVRGVEFEEVDVVRHPDPDFYQKLMARSGMKTVPQIFHGDRLIGGYSELAALDAEDQLKSLS